jgi:hypothetical protein
MGSGVSFLNLAGLALVVGGLVFGIWGMVIVGVAYLALARWAEAGAEDP